MCQGQQRLAFEIIYTRHADKQLDFYDGLPALQKNLNKQIAILKKNPYEPPCEALSGDLKGLYSRRINWQHRLVYRVERKKVIVVSVRSHYESV